MSQQATYSLAKALQHAEAAAFHIDIVITETQPKFNAKHFLTSLREKAKSISKAVGTRIQDSQCRSILKADLEDPTAWDAMTDIFISLSKNRREEMLEFASFLFDVEEAEKLRVEEGGMAQYDERIAPLRSNLKAFIREEERRLSIMKKHLEHLNNLCNNE